MDNLDGAQRAVELNGDSRKAMSDGAEMPSGAGKPARVEAVVLRVELRVRFWHAV